jgi:hypothetical protein
VEEIHIQLERAYTFFDFDTLRIFSERVGENRMRGYKAAVEQFNQKAKVEDKPLLVPLEEMALELPGSYILPKNDHLRRAFVQQFFQSYPTGRSPRENLALLNNPLRLGEFYRTLFENYIRALLPEMEALKNRAKEAGIANVPLKEKEPMDPELLAIRDRFLGHYQDLAEYRRILTEGFGNFRGEFLKTVFNEHRPLALLYRTLYFRVGELSGELQRLVSLPSIEQIQRMIRSSSPH